MKKRFNINKQGELVFASDVTFIKTKEFEGNNEIKKVIIPASVAGIDDYAFANCQNLVEVKFEKVSKCKQIRNGAFGGCVSLEKIFLPSSLKYLGAEVFFHCVSLKDIIIPWKCELIGKNAFGECIGLFSAKIMHPYAIIELGAFEKCGSLRKFEVYGKKYRTFTSFTHTTIYGAGVKYKGLNFYIVHRLSMGDGKRIIGKTHFVCEGTVDGDYSFGEGDSVREAYEEFCFQKNRLNELNNRHDWSTKMLVSVRDFRLISGSCVYGVKFFCKWKNIDPVKDKWPMEKVVEEITPLNNDKTVQAFLVFYERLKREES